MVYGDCGWFGGSLWWLEMFMEFDEMSVKFIEYDGAA